MPTLRWQSRVQFQKSNCVQCLACKAVLTSRSRHDFKMCPCDLVGIDGGISEGRLLGNSADMRILSVQKAEDGSVLDLDIVNHLILRKPLP